MSLWVLTTEPKHTRGKGSGSVLTAASVCRTSRMACSALPLSCTVPNTRSLWACAVSRTKYKTVTIHLKTTMARPATPRTQRWRGRREPALGHLSLRASAQDAFCPGQPRRGEARAGWFPHRLLPCPRGHPGQGRLSLCTCWDPEPCCPHNSTNLLLGLPSWPCHQ